MSVALVVISDREDKYLPQCLGSLAAHCDYRWDQVVTVDDRDHKLGLAGAVQQGWRQVDPAIDFVFHVEEDFLFVEPFRVEELVYVLERNPHLAQVVLKRQPWSPVEVAAGGIVECNPDGYVECGAFGRNVRWSEHREIFSLNPMLVPARVFRGGWPDSNEAGMTARCLDQGLRFAFFGGRFDAPRVLHVGADRGAGWKL